MKKENKKVIKGYKVFNPDWTCRDFKFEIGKTYEIKEEPILCEKGFHFCINLADCFNYYQDNQENKIAEVEALGDITELENNCSKLATNKIKIIREITKQESYIIGNQGKNNTGYRNTGNSNTGDWNTGYRNTGDWNTGNRNTGNRNTGYRNTGDWNTGNRNTGYRNTGDWNTGNRNTGYRNTGNSNTGDWNNCNYETGFFNTKQDEYINIFNKKCKRTDWDTAVKPSFIYFKSTEFIFENNMSDSEKDLFPEYKITGGYLKKYDYKEAFINSFNNADKSDIELLLKLPNFNYKVFEDISGISKKMIQNKLK